MAHSELIFTFKNNSAFPYNITTYHMYLSSSNLLPSAHIHAQTNSHVEALKSSQLLVNWSLFYCFNRSAAPLPDTGQWLLLALNEKLPQSVVDLLRAHVITLHHYLMLFIMLGFSVLFGCIKAPGLGIATRYMFTMAIGRLLRTMTFVATILPSARPWCAAARYQIPGHPHPWAQKYYVPYASDSDAIRRVIRDDVAYG